MEMKIYFDEAQGYPYCYKPVEKKSRMRRESRLPRQWADLNDYEKLQKSLPSFF
jgi:hypothetical protein